MHERFGEMLDTSPEARARYFEMARAGIRARRPHADAIEIALADTLYGPVAARAIAERLRSG